MTLRDRVNKARGVVHNTLYRLLGGRFVGRLGRAPILLLTTTGRHTGAPRTVPLFYVPDGERFVVVASNAGQDHHPAWLYNIQSNPEVRVEVGSRRMYAKARVATPDERATFWPRAVAMFRTYETYAKRTSRHISLVVVEPK